MGDTQQFKPENSTRRNGRYTAYRDLSLIYEGRNQDIPVRVPDLSPRGMFINTAREFPEGAVVKLHFRLDRSGYEVNARGEVRYCLPGVGIGVEFMDISSDAQRAIEKELSPSRDP